MNKKKFAFTLIEMLVVIAIIGIVAGMVISMNSAAAAAKRIAAVKAQKEKLVTMIENYQSKLNFYPPDNGYLSTNSNLALYDGLSATNPLIYELTGATNGTTNNTIGIQVFNNTPKLTYSEFAQVFNRANVANGDPGNPQDFYLPNPAPKDYANYFSNSAGTVLVGLTVPVPITTTNPVNFWHYDSSSPNRHNLTSYDLWAEYITGGKNGANIITTTGNW